MAVLGKTNRLEVLHFVDFGAYLDAGEFGEILLPRLAVPERCGIGDMIDVFVYRDSEDRVIATTNTPYAEVNSCASLEVAQINKFGAFLDWGLEKDLFVPFGEQTRPMNVGDIHVVYIYIDNTNRIAGTTKLRKFLRDRSKEDEFEKGLEVDLLITRPTDLGWETIINGKVLGMVFKSDELFPLESGLRVPGFIKDVREDGKIDVSLQPVGKQAKQDLTAQILTHLRANEGESTITDKSSPEDIYTQYGVSKKAYKRAVGMLYRAKKISVSKEKISLT